MAVRCACECQPDNPDYGNNSGKLKGRIYSPNYVSAYQIAVKNGFKGTEKEWLASLQGPKGDPGDSAYQIAVSKGFVGTEEEWLQSLKGEKGDRGPQGESAYEIAVDHGYIGTEEEWLDSLGAKYHNQLLERDAEDCHPISAITDLSNTLLQKVDIDEVGFAVPKMTKEEVEAICA